MVRQKLLAFAFVASIVINVTFLVFVGNSDIFQHADVIQDLKAQQIKVYKPPIPEKPKPKPKPKVKPPPPPKPPPKKVVIKPPAPKKVVVKPSVFKPPPRVKVAVAPTGSHTHGPGIAMPASQGDVGVPSASVTPPPPTPKPVPAPTPAPPAPTPAPAPPPAPKPEPAPAPPPPKPKPPAIPDRDTPEIVGSFGDLQLPGDVDMSSVTNTTVHAEWDVDSSGHAKNIHIDSSGNPDIDDAIREFIRNHHYEPAVHDGEPLEAHMEHTFDVGS